MHVDNSSRIFLASAASNAHAARVRATFETWMNDVCRRLLVLLVMGTGIKRCDALLCMSAMAGVGLTMAAPLINVLGSWQCFDARFYLSARVRACLCGLCSEWRDACCVDG